MFLPDDLRARNPEEVGTIVWLEDSESKAGDYHEEGTGIRGPEGPQFQLAETPEAAAPVAPAVPL